MVDDCGQAEIRIASPYLGLAPRIDLPPSSQMSKQSPQFDARNYGYSKLSSLIKAIELYEEKRTDNHLLVRRKPKKSPTP